MLDEECQTKQSVANIVRAVHNDWLRVRIRPYGTCRAPLVDEFATKLRDKTVEELEVELTKQEILDRMLLCLFDALFLKQSERWSNAGVSNLKVDETQRLPDSSFVAAMSVPNQFLTAFVRCAGHFCTAS